MRWRKNALEDQRTAAELACRPQLITVCPVSGPDGDGVQPILRNCHEHEYRAYFDNGAATDTTTSSFGGGRRRGRGFLRLHYSQHSALTEPQPAHIHTQHSIKVFRQTLRRGFQRRSDGGLVDKVVVAAELLDCLLHGMVDVGFRGLIEGEGEEVDRGC